MYHERRALQHRAFGCDAVAELERVFYNAGQGADAKGHGFHLTSASGASRICGRFDHTVDNREFVHLSNLISKLESASV